MLHSLRSVAVAALLIVPYASAATVGSGTLVGCTSCKPIYTAMMKSNTLAELETRSRNASASPNPDGWYGYLDTCRDCLSGNDFFDNLARTMSQLLVSCTQAGGNVVSDGESICASNAMWEECASLKDSSEGESWASFEKFSDPSQNSNGTQLLDLPVPNQSSATSVASTASQTTATTSATGTDSQAPSGTAATGTSSQAPSSTTDSQSTTTTAKPSSAARYSHGSQAGYALGMLIAAGVVGLLV